MGGMGVIFTPVLVRRLIGPPGLSRHLGLIATPNSPIGWCNTPPASHPPAHPLICAIRDIKVVLKKGA